MGRPIASLDDLKEGDSLRLNPCPGCQGEHIVTLGHKEHAVIQSVCGVPLPPSEVFESDAFPLDGVTCRASVDGGRPALTPSAIPHRIYFHLENN